MPIYEFQCDRCLHVFERLQKLSDPDPDTCPECGKPAIRKRLTAPAFRLSGSGWYETDFKKDGDKQRNLTEKSDAGAAEAKAGAGSDTRQEAKADSKPESKPTASSAAAVPAKPAVKPDTKPAPTPASKPAAE